MPAPDQSRWSVKYEDPRSDVRFLFSLPSPMLRDIRLLAKARGLTTSEMMRQLVAREVEAFLLERPETAASFRGKPSEGQLGG